VFVHRGPRPPAVPMAVESLDKVLAILRSSP
jgi:hypothetical protein